MNIREEDIVGQSDDHDGSTSYPRDFLLKFRLMPQCRVAPDLPLDLECIQLGAGLAPGGGGGPPGGMNGGDDWQRKGGHGSPRFGNMQMPPGGRGMPPPHMMMHGGGGMMHGGHQNGRGPSSGDGRWGHRPLPPVQMNPYLAS
ncbi:MAG: hypothetical protein VXZ39_01775, partial [Planctomycetota bacterium]|nr:hypothetical protein [Planctomycetota bacterium]